MRNNLTRSNLLPEPGSLVDSRDSAIQALIARADHLLGLPPRTAPRLETWDHTGWASFYGGLDALAEHARLLPGFPKYFDATWTHGIIEPWRYTQYPLQLTYCIQHALDRLILVINDEQVRALRSLGYSNVHAIGSPFVYAKPRRSFRRLPGSILLMPPHTLDDQPLEDEGLMCTFVQSAIERYHDKLDSLYACLHMSCVRNGLWWPILLRHGIPVIGGADHGDAASYRRMWQLFSMFETVSTTASSIDIGSHVSYALAAGCKVVLEGPEIFFPLDLCMEDVSFKRSLEICDGYLVNESFQPARDAFIAKFRTPRADRVLGDAMVGTAFKRSPAEIRALLGWSRREQLRQEIKRIYDDRYFKLAVGAHNLKRRLLHHS